MSRVITFSRTYPSYHPKAGQPTLFVEKVWESLDDIYGEDFDPPNVRELTVEQLRFLQQQNLSKNHTIRTGNRWKVGDKFSPRVWGENINEKSGRKGAYQSDMIVIAPDIEIKKLWNFEIVDGDYFLDGKQISFETPSGRDLFDNIATNDGLSVVDLRAWFELSPEYKKNDNMFSGQIICWSDKIEYKI